MQFCCTSLIPFNFFDAVLKENSFLQQEACENFKQKKIYNQIWSLETSDI